MVMQTKNRTQSQGQGQEIDIRLNMLNILLTTPHRELNKVYDIHKDMIDKDPIFYVRLAAWYFVTGEVKDHKEMFVINLALSNFEGHRDVAAAMLRELPPYQLARVTRFILGEEVPVYVNKNAYNKKTKKQMKTKAIAGKTKQGLYKNVPRTIVKEIERYLRERESQPAWFDQCAAIAKKDMKKLYKNFHIKPSSRAQSILFDNLPPEGSKMDAIKELNKAETPEEQAKTILKHKIPYRTATSAISAMTPTVLYALIQVMSPQDLINNLGSLKKRGAYDNEDLKDAINKKLKKAKGDKKVAALKTKVAKDNVENLDAETQEILDDIGDTQIKSKGRITMPTAMLVDKSSSMHDAIEIAQHIGSMISSVMDDSASFYAYAFDSMAYPINTSGKTLAEWQKAFNGIYANGCTSCGAGIQMLIRQKQYVEQIIMITDQSETSTPRFLPSLKEYIDKMKIKPRVTIVTCGTLRSKQLEERCRNNDIDYEAYEFNGDYYSLPGLVQYLTKPSKLDLLMDIMSYPLPERRAA